LLPNETLTLNQFTYKSIPYDPEKDFDPITNAFINTQVMVVSAALNVKSLDELAALSKTKPGTLSYSALAIPMQITIENWKKKTGADLVFVPVRGGGEMVTGILTGHHAGRDCRLAEFHFLHSQQQRECDCGRFRGAFGAVSASAHAGRAGL